MIITFKGQSCMKYQLFLDTRGPLRASFQTLDEPPAKGSLIVAGQPIQCTTFSKNLTNGIWDVEVFAGGAGWDKTLPAKSFEGPLKLSDVLRATAIEAGEILRVGAEFDRSLPYGYVRKEGKAQAIFRDLPWYVDDAGTTVVGNRAKRQVSPETAYIRKADSGFGEIEGYADALIFPGDSVKTADGTWSEIGSVWIAPDGFHGTTAASTSLRDTLLKVVPPPQVGAYTSAAIGLISVKGNCPKSAGRWYAPGLSVVESAGTKIAAAMLDGDPGTPVALGADATPAVSVRWAAGSLRCGPTGTQPVALAAPLVAALGALCASIQSAGAATPGAPVTAGVLAGYFATLATALSGVPSVTFFVE